MHNLHEGIRMPEAASQQALHLEFHDYLNSRSHFYSKTGQGWQFEEGLGADLAYSNLRLLEDTSVGGELVVSEPDATICMPVAILQEDDKGILHAINVIKKAQTGSSKSIEIILWANAEDSSEEVAIVAMSKYSDLKAKLSALNGDGFRIRTALQLLSTEKATMSNIRANMMDAVALDAVNRNFTFEHPTLWLDADTTFATVRGFAQLIDRIQRLDALFVHANLQYSIDWAEERNLEELDDITKAIVVHEIARRIDTRPMGDRMPSGYVEECGLGFALGTYLWAGGVSTFKALSESATLIDRAKNRRLYEKIEGSRSSAYAAQKFLGRQLPEVVQVPEARIGMSARRLKVVAQTDGVQALNSTGRDYREDLGLFTQIQNKYSVPRTVRRGEMDKLLAVDRRGKEERKKALGEFYLDNEWERRWEHRNRIIACLIDEYFGE